MSDKGLRKAVLIGAIVGALVTLAIALSMDLFFADTLQGSWRDAAVKDVTRMFGPACGQNVFAVMLVLAVVMAFLAGFGAVMGAAAGLIMNRFFKMLLKS
jgi:hypothetical protein